MITRLSDYRETGPVQVPRPLPPAATLIGPNSLKQAVTLKIRQYVFPKCRNKIYYTEYLDLEGTR